MVDQWVSLNGDAGYDLSAIDTTQENFLIEETDFSIERRRINKIHVFMTENPSSSERIPHIALQAGNYVDGIKIVQWGSAK